MTQKDTRSNKFPFVQLFYYLNFHKKQNGILHSIAHVGNAGDRLACGMLVWECEALVMLSADECAGSAKPPTMHGMLISETS